MSSPPTVPKQPAKPKRKNYNKPAPVKAATLVYPNRFKDDVDNSAIAERVERIRAKEMPKPDPHSTDHKLRFKWRDAACIDERWDAWTKTLDHFMRTPRTWPDLRAWATCAWPGFPLEFIQHLLAFLSLRGRVTFDTETQCWRRVIGLPDHIASMRNPPPVSITDAAGPAGITALTNYSFKSG